MNNHILLNNYIPHKKENKNKYKKWYNFYENDLKNLFGIYIEEINNKYELDIDNYERYFDEFCNFIFINSSRYIPKWA